VVSEPEALCSTFPVSCRLQALRNIAFVARDGNMERTESLLRSLLREAPPRGDEVEEEEEEAGSATTAGPAPSAEQAATTPSRKTPARSTAASAGGAAASAAATAKGASKGAAKGRKQAPAPPPGLPPQEAVMLLVHALFLTADLHRRLVSSGRRDAGARVLPLLSELARVGVALAYRVLSRAIGGGGSGGGLDPWAATLLTSLLVFMQGAVFSSGYLGMLEGHQREETQAGASATAPLPVA
jgi:hypothetical protein